MKGQLNSVLPFLCFASFLYILSFQLGSFTVFLWLGMLLFAFVKKRIDWVFLLLIIDLIFSDYIVNWPLENHLDWAKPIRPIGLIALTFFLLKSGDLSIKKNKIFKNFLPFFIIVFVALIYALDLITGIQKNISYLLLMLSVPALVNIENFKQLIEKVLFFNLIVVFLGIVLSPFFPEILILEEGGGRLKGFFGNPNGLAIFSILTIMLYYGFKETYSIKYSKLLHYSFLIVFALAIVLSGSRNGVISLGLFLVLLRMSKLNKGLSFGVFVISLLLGVYFSTDFAPLIQNLGLGEYFRVQTLGEGSGRAVAWGFAWQKLQSYYFLGGGFGQDEQVMRPNYAFLSKLGHEGGVHNSYISLWFDAGILGLIAYFGALISLISSKIKTTQIGLPFLFVVLFNISFESWLVGSINPFTIFFVLTLSLIVTPNLKYEQTSN